MGARVILSFTEHLHNRSKEIGFTVPGLCSAFGVTNSVWCVMSCWNRVAPSQGIGIEGNLCVWAKHWRRNGHSTKRDTSKLSSSITLSGHILLDRSRHTWKHWNGRSYSTCRTIKTLLLPTNIYFDRWHTAWLFSISALMKKSKNGSIRRSPQKTHHFFEMISNNFQKDGKK